MDILENEPHAPRWRIRYTLANADLTAFRRFDAKRRRIERLTSITGGIAFLFMFFLFRAEMPFLGLAAAALASLGVTLAIVAVAIGLGSFGMQRLLKKASREAGEITQEFFPDRLAAADARYRTEYRWRSFTDIVRGQGATYYYFTRTQAIIVPDRAFPTPEDAIACAEFAAEHWRFLSEEQPRATASPSPFAITFTMDDSTIVHQTYGRAALRRWLRRRLIYILVSSIMVIALVWIAIQTAFQPGTTIWEIIAPCVIAAFLLAQLYRGYAPAQIVRRARRTGGLEPRTVRLDPGSMTLHNSKSTSQIRWESIKRVEEDDRLIYIDLIGGSWFTIPVAAFLDREHHKAFVDAISAYREGRNPDTPSEASWPPAPGV